MKLEIKKVMQLIMVVRGDGMEEDRNDKKLPERVNGATSK